jgi:hypothetical protein
MRKIILFGKHTHPPLVGAAELIKPTQTEKGKTNYGRAETQVVAAAAALSFNGAISVAAGVAAAAADASRRPPARQKVIAALATQILNQLSLERRAR